MLDEWAALDARHAARDGARGNYSSGFRCWSCKLYVGSLTADCIHCGQPHGGVHHNAYATR